MRSLVLCLALASAAALSSAPTRPALHALRGGGKKNLEEPAPIVLSPPQPTSGGVSLAVTVANAKTQTSPESWTRPGFAPAGLLTCRALQMFTGTVPDLAAFE